MSSTVTTVRAALLYLAATVAMTWPLASEIGSSVPGDLGDPLLNAWILVWGAEHIGAMLSGDVSAFARWWQANIFHPAPLALAYSEHLFPQALAALPVYAATGNALLVYNLTFLSTFVLSGVGMFLLVRELTGNPRAAFVAGLFFAFVPYRISQTPHVQVLSSQWMPLALYAFRRYFETGRTRALAGAVAALLLQQLSCGYYLVFFTPLVAVYLAWEISARRKWRDWRLLASLGVAALVDLALAWPFVAPYLEVRALDFAPRGVAEVQRFSADLFGYLAAHETNRVWGGRIAAFAKPENDLFPGVLPVATAAIAMVLFARARWRAIRDVSDVAPRWVIRVLLLAAALATAAIVAVVATGGFRLRAAGMTLLQLREIDRAILVLLVALAGVLIVSRRARVALSPSRDLHLPAFLLLLGAVVLSLGPVPAAGGEPLGFIGPYSWLYQLIPGFDGLRVPARFAMVAYVFLAVLGGYGLAAVDALRYGRIALVATAVLFLLEATAAPIRLNASSHEPGVAPPPARVQPASAAPPVYKVLERLPSNTVVVEFPFGHDTWELRYVFYSSLHLHRLLNGYSGGFPRQYVEHDAVLARPGRDPAAAWAALRRAAVTHVVVHRGAYLAGNGQEPIAWLVENGARHLGSYGTDELFEMPGK